MNWYLEHLLLWDWLLKHPGRDKNEWPGWKGRLILADCFACEEAYDRMMESEEWDYSRCPYCPLSWYGWERCNDWAYRAWWGAMDEKNYRAYKYWARKIRNAPLKVGVVRRKRMMVWAVKFTARPAESVG